MIEFLFLDLDDTILDFHKAERIALSKTIRDFGIEPAEDVLRLYHEINRWHWEQLEKGALTREEVLVNRFGVLFKRLGKEVDAHDCARAYEKNLSIGHWFLPGAEEAVDRLHKKYRLFLASNGTASVQKGRMTSANLYRFFETVFVSQEIGHNKPSKEYFDACFAAIPGFDREKAMIVGDSLTSDIKGGINAGIRTVWVNPEHKPCGEIKPDYEIEALSQLEELLDRL
ncbi:MAG: YjjG family noncanonical pyrimidine nucleotidase [Oscillospiraceae bacterium]|nr:YjjG family noncanonical pyrimidine nucleotidase [Oscillospiraceae bacterium]MBQ3193696.1 YjjG family noncanonical pyrimidine nucleotidase [Oscillospiraceae bacterium]MBQ7129444.1 YjjG family noncanonical pyrimidine nucleotidase [Oscillospiraceae bacterium]